MNNMHVCTQRSMLLFSLLLSTLLSKKDWVSHLESIAVLTRMAGQVANEPWSCLSHIDVTMLSAAGLNSSTCHMASTLPTDPLPPPFFGKQFSKTNTKSSFLTGYNK